MAKSPSRRRSSWVTVAFTWNGLRALGVNEASLATFPEEFRQGMASARGRSWATEGTHHPETLGRRARERRPACDRDSLRTRRRGARTVRRRAPRAARALPGVEVLSFLDLEATPPFEYAHDHFGYRDRLSQPVDRGIGRRADARLRSARSSPASSSSAIPTRWARPRICLSRVELARNGRYHGLPAARGARGPVSRLPCVRTARRPQSRSYSRRS